ncbi:3-keto-disaccharide hydrolase [Blastopirellula marina]|uniref:3-keto-alpha-glucoside-1,2-lyase/3-keto-2-hydroxy-glucal hydratase domain-containing protein n=1 Tax=Blastopirellula marina DSM 3645 TaxID=314230 RepID=A3ZQW0_9BACT|nr:DUF1080 domain-containing protein [Blastopirellula marina]EAQ81050.1 hypothetical protein DSM3645_20802 [Blastopirellula marina DSM 3645]
MLKRIASALLLGLVACSFSLAADADGFKPLFNGKNLEGFTQHGGKAVYTIEGDEIVGTSTLNTPNTFLCTNKEYGDFILEVDFKVDPKLNSGIQIRSQVFPEATEVDFGDGKMKKMAKDRVHGYQVEIDPSARAWSGGIYDEARRGWLNDLKNNPEAGKAFKQDDWNHYRIECRGDSIKTWINGVPAADLKDGLTSKGLIALQVHGIGGDKEKAGTQVRWKNIMIKELD